MLLVGVHFQNHNEEESHKGFHVSDREESGRVCEIVSWSNGENGTRRKWTAHKDGQRKRKFSGEQDPGDDLNGTACRSLCSHCTFLFRFDR